MYPGKLLTPFMVTMDHAQEMGAITDELDYLETAYQAGELFKQDANGEAVSVTEQDMELYRIIYGAKGNSKLKEVIADHGTSLATTLATAAVVSLVAPAPGGRIGAAVLGLSSLVAGAFVSGALDDAGVNEMVSSYVSDHFSEKEFDELKRGTVFENLSYDQAVQEMVRQTKEMIPDDMKSDNFNENPQANLNMPMLNNQNVFEENHYGGHGSMDNQFMDISIERPVYG